MWGRFHFSFVSFSLNFWNISFLLVIIPVFHLSETFFLCWQVIYALPENYQEDLLGHFFMTLLFDINYLVILSRNPQLFLALSCHLSSIHLPLTFQLIWFSKISIAIHQCLRSHYLACNVYSCSSLPVLLLLVFSGFQYMSTLMASFLLLVLQVYQDILLMIYVV